MVRTLCGCVTRALDQLNQGDERDNRDDHDVGLIAVVAEADGEVARFRPPPTIPAMAA